LSRRGSIFRIGRETGARRASVKAALFPQIPPDGMDRLMASWAGGRPPWSPASPS